MISKIHYITQGTDRKTQIEAVKTFCEGGADWVQLRVKNADFWEWAEIAKEARQITIDAGAKLIINDNVQIAVAVQADGVHLGKNDMSVQNAREVLGKNYIIGGTANTFLDVDYLVAQGVDYIGLGPYRFTTTKENLSPILGLEGYKNMMTTCKNFHINTPILAIGGIVADDVEEIVGTGVHGIAISGEVLKASKPVEKMKQLKELIEAKHLAAS